MGRVEHYFSAKQSCHDRPFKIHVSVKRECVIENFDVWSAKGIFSKDHLDKASRLLIENCIVRDGWDVLDLGCGYGVVGIAVKRFFPGCNVVFSDVNERALRLVKKSLLMNKLEGEVVKSDGFSGIDRGFDCILLNPPFAAGRDVCFGLVDGAFSHLNREGLLQVVARHKKGGAVLSDHMKEIFGNVDVVARGSGFRVYCSVK